MHGNFIPTVMDLVRVRGEARSPCPRSSLPGLTVSAVWRREGRNRCRVCRAGDHRHVPAAREVRCLKRRCYCVRCARRRCLRGICHADARRVCAGYLSRHFRGTDVLYAANNICKAIQRLASRIKSTCRLAGVICNAKDQPQEEELVAEFAKRVNSSLIQFIPRDRVVQLAELNRKTVIEYDPHLHRQNVTAPLQPG